MKKLEIIEEKDQKKKYSEPNEKIENEVKTYEKITAKSIPFPCWDGN